MLTRENKPQEKTIQAVSNSLNAQSAEGKSAIHLQDNRPQSIVQKKQADALANRRATEAPVQKKENNTGLPDQLKSGIENLSGHSMDDVKVHYNSDKPAQLNAHAYAQGADIHLAAGQEKHLAHEAWHVVQQKQGRVKPTLQMKGKVNINDDKGLEKEADMMGARAWRNATSGKISQTKTRSPHIPFLLQRKKSNGTGRPSYKLYQLVPASVVQRIYLRGPGQGHPVWTADAEPPAGYLASGKYNDGEHGESNFYATMNDLDLFYGISYEEGGGIVETFNKTLMGIATANELDIETPAGIVAAIKIYTSTVGQPPLDVEAYKNIFGGSSGWDRYTGLLKGGTHSAEGEKFEELNPGLNWTTSVTGLACQKAMIKALAHGGTIRFVLDGMSHIHGILGGTAYQGKITSHELNFLIGLIGKTIVLPHGTITPREGRQIFFYLNSVLIPLEDIPSLGKPIEKLAFKLAEKIAEEEEWDDDEEDLAEIADLIMKGLTIHEIQELLDEP